MFGEPENTQGIWIDRPVSLMGALPRAIATDETTGVQGKIELKARMTPNMDLFAKNDRAV